MQTIDNFLEQTLQQIGVAKECGWLLHTFMTTALFCLLVKVVLYQ